MAQVGQQVQTAKPVAKVASVKPGQEMPTEGKKWYKNWLIWLIVVIVIGGGLGLYFWLA